MNQKSFPKITVITPVKNGAATLEKAIKSLLTQNYPNLEYIVIDGASTDGTLDIIKKYEKNIDYWQSSNDGGSVIAHIEGIKKANGEIIAFLNSDDFYEPGIFEKVAETFVQNPEIDLVSFRFRALKDGVVIEETTLEDAELTREKFIKIPGMNARFFKKESFYKYGFPQAYDDSGRAFVSNDLEFLSRFALKGIKNKVIDFVGYNYTSHDESLTFSKRPENLHRLYEDRIFIAKKFLESKEIELPKVWKKSFVKWIKKYRAMLVISHLRLGNWKTAMENFYAGLKENNPLKFVFYVMKTWIRGKKNKKIGF